MDSQAIQDTLLSKDSSRILPLLKEVREKRQFDALYSVVLSICGQVENIRLNKKVVVAISSEYMPMLGAMSAYEQAVTLVDLIRKGLNRSTIAVLLQKLIFSVQLMSAAKLREYVKSDIVQLHSELFVEDRETSAILSVCVFYALSMEFSYSSSLSSSELAMLKNIWERMLAVEESGKSAILQLTSFMFYTSLDEDASECLRKISTQNLLKVMIQDRKLESSLADLDHVNAAYEYTVFELIMTNISLIALNMPKKKLPQVFDFLICAALKYQMMKQLSARMSHLSNLRYSNRIELISKLVLEALDEYKSADKKLFVDGNNLFNRKRTASENGVSCPLSKLPKAEKLFEEFTAKNFKTICEKHDDELKKLLSETSTAQLAVFVNSMLNSDGMDIKKEGPSVLKILNCLLCKRKNFNIQWSPRIAEIMMSEEGLKTSSLLLAANLLTLNRDDQMPGLISLCISFFEPVSWKYLNEWEDSPSIDASVHEYVLSKLEFLLAVFKHFPNVAKTQTSLLIMFLPDFFMQISTYKKRSMYFQAEQLEQKLSALCRDIKRQKASFHKFIPFVISCSMTGEREINFPTFILLSMCDDHDLAVLSTNLPPQEKKKYSNIQTQFYKLNKIIG